MAKLLYKKNRYLILILSFAISVLYYDIFKYDILNKINVPRLENEVVFSDLKEYFKSKKYSYEIFYLEDDEQKDLTVIKKDKNIQIFIYGDFFFTLSEEEKRSLMFQKIGLVENHNFFNIKFFKMILSLFDIMGDFLIIYSCHEITNTFDKNFYQFIALKALKSVALFPIFNSFLMIFSNYEILKADNFSAILYSGEFLISALIKKTLQFKEFYSSSLLYNVLFLDHPRLEQRINKIQMLLFN